MTIQEILALGKMGYTKADIDAMTRENAAGETKPETVPAPAEVPNVPQNAPAAVQNPKPQDSKTAEPPKAAGTEFDRLMKRLDELTAAMQENNRAAAEMGANIINPRAAAIGNIAAISGLNLKKEE